MGRKDGTDKMMEEWIMMHTAPGRFVQERELVRCKDCIHAQHDILFTQWWCDGRVVKVDGFCDKGEKKDD